MKYLAGNESVNNMFESINPATGKTIRTYSKTTQIQGPIEEVHQSWLNYRHTSWEQRTKWMFNLAEELRTQRSSLAQLMTDEMGKVIGEALAEVDKCAWVCDYYAKHAAEFLKPEKVTTDASESYVAYEPLGVILAVMPWNFPFWQVFRFAAPALMAGNTALLKHASNVSGCALAIESLIVRAGFPHQVFKTLLISSDRVKEVIAHPAVKAVTLTGSEAAGRSVAGTAGSYLKKCVLELGGSDPYVILADADVELAVETCVKSRLINAGQSCIAAKRFILVPEIYDAFTARFIERMKQIKVGDPQGEDTGIGPMARRDLRDELHNQVVRSVAMGAKILLGGSIPEGEGAYYPPTVLAEVTPEMPAFNEELFGPVAPMIRAENEEHALSLANDSDFGLGAALFTRDLQRGKTLAEHHFQSGSCFVNGLVKSDPRLPFGGINHSGYGRELSHHGIKEFVNIKTVWIK